MDPNTSEADISTISAESANDPSFTTPPSTPDSSSSADSTPLIAEIIEQIMAGRRLPPNDTEDSCCWRPPPPVYTSQPSPPSYTPKEANSETGERGNIVETSTAAGNGLVSNELDYGEDPEVRLTRRRTKAKKKTKTLEYLSQISTLLITLAMFILTSLTLSSFTSTRYIVISSYHIWPHTPNLHPTLLLLWISGLSSTLALACLVSCVLDLNHTSSFRNTDHGKDEEDEEGQGKKGMIGNFSLMHWIGVVARMVYVGVWITAAVIVGMSQVDRNGLWGWSCEGGRDGVDADVEGGVDFERICAIQTSAWILSLIEITSKLVFAAIHFFFLQPQRTRSGGDKRGEYGRIDCVDGVFTQLEAGDYS